MDPPCDHVNYRTRFERSRLAQSECDADGRLTLVNDALCELVGRSRGDLIGMPACTLNHDDDPGTADRRLGRLLSGEEDTAQYERVLCAADGTTVPVFVDATLLRDAAGRPTGAAASYQDLRPLRESERLRHRQQELHDAFERLSREPAIVGDAEGTLLYASPAVYSLLGYDPEDVVSRDGWSFVHPDDLVLGRGQFELVVRDGGTRSWCVRLRTADGTWRWVEQTATNLLDSPVGGIVSNLRDISERIEAEQALRASEHRFRMIAETAQEGICTVTRQGEVVFANERLAVILGIPLAEIYASNALSRLSPAAADDAGFRLQTRAQRGPERYELRYPHPDGTDRVLAVSASPLPLADRGETGSLGMLSDITDLRRYERELADAALRDDLTGLPNRALLVDRLEQALRRVEAPTGLLVVALDRLQLVNQQHGHRVGDGLLAAVGQRLLDVASSAVSVGRLTGDTFAVVCESTDDLAAVDHAREVLGALARPFAVEDTELHVTASIGVAVAGGASADELLRRADAATRAAKAAGRNCVYLFDESLAARLTHRQSIAGDLRAALSSDRLALEHQPIVDLRNGFVVGTEALLRWDHPSLGPVLPDQLLPVALLSGLATELDDWVLQRALAEHGRLRAAGRIPPDAYLAVNLTAVSVTALELDRRLAKWAGEHGVPLEHLVLEITETAALESNRSSDKVLARLREQGVGIALDDFGTGHGSLSFLRDLPVTALKIDSGLVRDVLVDADALAITASIVDLARAVGISAVAEGVETVEQVAVLHRLGCAQAQGRLWSPPLPAAQIELSGSWTHPFDTARKPASPSASRPGPPVEQSVQPEHGLDRLLELHRDGASLATVAAALNSEGFRTPGGARWHRTSVARVVASAAYPTMTQPGDG